MHRRQRDAVVAGLRWRTGRTAAPRCRLGVAADATCRVAAERSRRDASRRSRRRARTRCGRCRPARAGGSDLGRRSQCATGSCAPSEKPIASTGRSGSASTTRVGEVVVGVRVVWLGGRAVAEQVDADHLPAGVGEQLGEARSLPRGRERPSPTVDEHDRRRTRRRCMASDVRVASEERTSTAPTSSAVAADPGRTSDATAARRSRPRPHLQRRVHGAQPVVGAVSRFDGRSHDARRARHHDPDRGVAT